MFNSIWIIYIQCLIFVFWIWVLLELNSNWKFKWTIWLQPNENWSSFITYVVVPVLSHLIREQLLEVPWIHNQGFLAGRDGSATNVEEHVSQGWNASVAVGRSDLSHGHIIVPQQPKLFFPYRQSGPSSFTPRRVRRSDFWKQMHVPGQSTVGRRGAGVQPVWVRLTSTSQVHPTTSSTQPAPGTTCCHNWSRNLENTKKEFLVWRFKKTFHRKRSKCDNFLRIK